MASNCLAPAFAQISYTANGHPHVMRLGVINTNADVTEVNDKSGTSIDADTALTSLIDLIKGLYHTSDEFTRVDWFTQADCESAPVWKRTYDFGGGLAGESSAADVAWGQAVLTFKTSNGGRFKLQLMESIILPNQKVALDAVGAGTVTDIKEALLDDTDFVVGYDNGYPAAALNYVTKINDSLRRKYLNP